MGLGNKGWWETSWDRQGHSSRTQPEATWMPPPCLLFPRLHCRVAMTGRARRLLLPRRPWSTALGKVCAWLPGRPCCPQRWGSTGCHQCGTASGVPRVVGCPVPASVPNHKALDTWGKIQLVFQSAHWPNTKGTRPAYNQGLPCLNLIESLRVLLSQA